VALVYPNGYGLAVSNLGFQQVYFLLNREDDLVCERFVYPERGRPLRSLESSRPLTDFPLVFVSVSFEHDFPRLAAMLAAGLSSPLARERAETIGPGDPLVVMGGVAIFMNPEPVAPLADAMAIGEAEPLLPPLLEVLRELIRGRDSRTRARYRLAGLKGCYVPGLYRMRHDDLGRLREIEVRSGAPERVVKVVQGRAATAAHSRILSPAAELSMYMVELGRGCSRGCRFCAAGYIYRPPRLWSAEAVGRAVEERPSGQDRIGLLGMEMAEDQTLDHILHVLRRDGCRLSFSSLRADRINGRLLDLLAASRLRSVAIAPDGASERLRRVINKGVSEEDLLMAAERLAGIGIRNLKLYVMVGLPGETRDDLDELADLLARMRRAVLPASRRHGRMVEIQLSVNSFVPKPWTPFQYLPYGGLDREEAFRDRDGTSSLLALKEKIRYLRRMVKKLPNIHLRADRPERILEQAVFSRGDRRLTPVLMDMGRGMGFRQALRSHGLSAWSFAIRPRDPDERFCWEVLDHGLRPGYLYQELARGLAARQTPPCRPEHCRLCGVCDGESAS